MLVNGREGREGEGGGEREEGEREEGEREEGGRGADRERENLSIPQCTQCLFVVDVSWTQSGYHGCSRVATCKGEGGM